MEPNSNYANVTWKHNFPAGSSEFVLEFTLDSKKPDPVHVDLPKPNVLTGLEKKRKKAI